MRSKDPSQICLVGNFPRAALVCDATTTTRTLLLNFLSLVIIEVAGKWREQTLPNTGVLRFPSFDLMPDDFVKPSSGGGVGNVETHSRGILGSSPGRPAQGTQGWIHLEKRLFGFNRCVWREVGSTLKACAHVVRNQVEQRKRRQTKNQLNRFQE